NEMHAMRIKLVTTEERAAELEASNAKLRNDFSRLKGEVKKGDGRRQRREARWKEMETKLRVEKEACETKLRQLTRTDPNLTYSVNERLPLSDNKGPLVPSRSQQRDVETKDVTEPNRREKRFRNTRNDHQLNTKLSTTAPIDIWTTNSNESGQTTPSAAEPAINISSIAISEAHHDPDALRELDGNSYQDYPSQASLPPDTPYSPMNDLPQMDPLEQLDFPSTTEPWLTSASKRMNDRRQTIASPQPSVVTMPSSAVRDSGTPKADPGWRRDPGLVPAAASRRSTLTGVRNRSGDMPPDRMAAAKARLAQRKSLKENRR
ncbi:MAG: hypothetical protein Q9174_005791, partial [Haloplaca sp. 1 TL-2023]